MLKTSQKVMGLAVILVALGVVAGCGSSNTSSGSKSATIGQGASKSKTKIDAATAAGKKTGAAVGSPVAVPKNVTIGIVSVLSAAEALQRTQAAAKAATKVLGWKVKICDAQGQPAKAANCANTLIAQNVSAIIGEAIEPAWVAPQLKLAKSKGIIWLNDAGPVTPGNKLIAANTTYSENDFGTAIGKYAAKALGGKGEVANTEISAQYAIRARTAALLAALKSAPGIKVVETHDVALADPVSDGRQFASAILTRYPKLSAILIGTDADSAGIVPVVAKKFPGKQYPDRPLVVGAFGDLAQLAMIRRGQMDAAIETPIESTAWIAVDRITEYLARKTSPPDGPHTGYPLNLVPVTPVDKTNLPSDPKEYFPSPTDFVSFFKAKWSAEYTGLP
jgi:ABC-type sugar transport system substrate-binding protein